MVNQSLLMQRLQRSRI